MAQVTYIEDFQIQWMVAQWQLINSTCFKLKFKTFSGSLLVNNVLICHQFLLINTSRKLKKKMVQYLNEITGYCRNK